MSNQAHREGLVRSTPEGGPLSAGTPAPEPGAGQVRLTPEAGPLPETPVVQPPSWREQMRGPIPGLDTAPSAAAAGGPAASGASAASASGAPEAPSGEEPSGAGRTDGSERTDRPVSAKPPYSGKPVSDVPLQEALKLARPVLSVAEKVLISAIDLTGQGLTGLARYLERKREEREKRG